MDNSMYSVGVAEDVNVGDETFALIFSEPLPGDEGYCVVAEPGQRTEYRAIKRCEIGGSAMRVVLTNQAADVLDLPRELVLELDLSDADVARLEGGLRRVGVPLTADR
jgi:Immunity protein 10